ncbi:MAG: hypothetical protein R2838_17760 [Caldilineaceae bacterium]
MVCQIAKLKGCRVVGSAGSEAKVAWLTEAAGVGRGVQLQDHARACGAAQNSVPTAWMSTSTTWAVTIWRPRFSA